MDGKRVQQLVGDEDAFERFGQRRAGARQPIAQVAECRRLRIARRGTRVDQVQTNMGIELGMTRSNRREDVRGQAAIAGAGFHEIEV